MILCYYVPFVDFISIFLLCVFLDFNPAFNDAADCAWVVAFQSVFVAYPYFKKIENFDRTLRLGSPRSPKTGVCKPVLF